MPTVVNCRRRRRTLRDTTSALSHTLLDVPGRLMGEIGSDLPGHGLGRRQGHIPRG